MNNKYIKIYLIIYNYKPKKREEVITSIDIRVYNIKVLVIA
jgi:hypothetical protein